jgi:hypothetical protein
MNWVFISQKTTFFIVTAVVTSSLANLGTNVPPWQWLRDKLIDFFST